MKYVKLKEMYGSCTFKMHSEVEHYCVHRKICKKSMWQGSQLNSFLLCKKQLYHVQN